MNLGGLFLCVEHTYRFLNYIRSSLEKNRKIITFLIEFPEKSIQNVKKSLRISS